MGLLLEDVLGWSLKMRLIEEKIKCGKMLLLLLLFGVEVLIVQESTWLRNIMECFG